MARHISDILREWFYRLPNGYALKPYNQKELQVLEQVLVEKGIDASPIIKSLHEMDQLDQAFLDAEPVEEAVTISEPGVNQTALKEGLVVIAIKTWEKHSGIIEHAIDLFKEWPKYNAKAKKNKDPEQSSITDFLTPLGINTASFISDAKTIANLETTAMDGGSDWIEWVFTAPISDAHSKMRTFINGMSAGNAILNTSEFSFNGETALVDRGQTLDAIKKYASKSIEKGWPKDMGGTFKFGPDRWNPADIMIFKDGKVDDYNNTLPPGVPEVEGQSERSINAIFHNEPGSKENIIGISLKEASAQGGKANNFAEMIEPKETWPEMELQLKGGEKELIRTLYFITPEPGQPVPAVSKYGNENGPYSIGEEATIVNNQPAGIDITFKEFKKLAPNKRSGDYAQAEKLNIHPKEAYVLRKYNESVSNFASGIIKGGEKAKAAFPQWGHKKATFDAVSRTYNNLPPAEWFKIEEHVKFKESIKDDLSNRYNNEVQNFKTNLSKYAKDVKLNSDKLSDPADMDELTIIRKIAIAQYFNYVLKNFDKGKFTGTTLSKIAEASGPFVAITMMAVGQAGASPTFYKAFGHEKNINGGKVEIFHGDGTLKLSNKQNIKMFDSPTMGGYNLTYDVDVYNGDTKHSTHSTKLDLRFSKWTIRVEIGKYKQI